MVRKVPSARARAFSSLIARLTLQATILFACAMLAVAIASSIAVTDVIDARRLQWTLGILTLLGLLAVALATWKAAGRITQPLARLDEAADGSRPASTSRSEFAARTNWRGSPAASTRWPARSPSASSASHSSPSTTC